MEENYAAKMADRLRELRESRGLSMREVARRAGLPPETVSRSERGINAPSIATLARICAGLSVDLPTFFDWARQPEPVRQWPSQIADEMELAIKLLSRQSAGQIRKVVGALGALLAPAEIAPATALAGADEKPPPAPKKKQTTKKRATPKKR